jgi:hypothetical protein
MFSSRRDGACCLSTTELHLIEQFMVCMCYAPENRGEVITRVIPYCFLNSTFSSIVTHGRIAPFLFNVNTSEKLTEVG